MNPNPVDPYDFSIKEIDGVNIYYKNLPWAPCIHIRWQLGIGAFNDPHGKEGLSHFLEHIIGNGSPSLPDKKAIKDFSRLYMLNSRNAFTSHYTTGYVGKCLPEHFSTVFRMMREYVFEPIIRPEDVEHERKVITQESWGRYKNPKFKKYIKEMLDNVYHGHEHSRIASPLGWPETVASISQEDIINYHSKYYVKENLSIFIVGAIEENHLEELGEILKNIPTGDKVGLNVGKIGAPIISRIEKNGDEIGDPKEQLDFSIMRATDVITKEDDEVSDQTRALLYDLLFERLRIERSLCYGVQVIARRYQDFLEFGVEVDTGKENLEIVEKEIWNVINEVINGQWKDRFNTIHKLTIDQIRSSERVSDSIINYASYDIVLYNKIYTLSEMLENAGSVTYEKVQEFVKRIFDPKFIFTAVIIPESEVK